MSELKPCSCCRSFPESRGYGECDHTDESYMINALFGCSNQHCPNHNAEMSEKECNTRPIEDALRAENIELKNALIVLMNKVSDNYGATRAYDDACRVLGIKNQYNDDESGEK